MGSLDIRGLVRRDILGSTKVNEYEISDLVSRCFGLSYIS